MGEWSEQTHNIPLRTLALQFAVSGHDAISTTAIGCRTAQEVDEICDSMLEEIPDTIWEEFDEVFSSEVAALSKGDHWFYDKAASDLG